MTNLFQKKPIIIEAVQFDGGNFEECKDFAGELCMRIPDRETAGIEHLAIETIGGAKWINIWDWIVKGSGGTLSKWSDEEFKESYEAVISPDPNQEK